MKKHTRRLLPALLALLLVLSLAPSAFMSGSTGGDSDQPSETPGPGEETPAEPAITKFSLIEDFNGQLETVTPDKEYNLTLEPDLSSAGSVVLSTILEPDNDTTRKTHIVWNSSDKAVVRVDEQQENGQYGQGHSATIVGLVPGEATVTAAPEKTTGLDITIHAEVSGIKLSDELTAGLKLEENETRTLTEGKDYFLFGRAKDTTEKISASEINNKTIVEIPDPTSKNNVTIEGRKDGTGTIRLRLSAGGRVYEKEFPVTVTSSVSVIPWTAGASPAKPLKFSDLESLIAAECQKVLGQKLASVIGLSVPTSQGTLYLGYQSPDDTGAGVASSGTYYAQGSARGPYLGDITFVPNASFGGEKAEISFTGNGEDGRSFKGRIEVTITDAKTTDVTLTTRSDVPLKLKAEDFARVCQEQTGASLSYVIFTLPPATEGVLYRDYKNELDYAAKVSASEQYNRKDLDTVTFVPNRDFVGTVTVGYAGYSVTGVKYNGQLVINVERSLDANIQYQDHGAGSITLSGADFDAYCRNMTGSQMSTVSFTPPAASQGTLYRSGTTASWNAVTGGESFSAVQLNYVTFVAADGFDGVVRIPFTGKARNGKDFSGTAELHIQAPVAQNGDIRYTCQPGQSVKLQVTDFANLCQSMTGQRLYYVTFQALPDHTQGSLFYNRTSSGAIGTRVTTVTKYFNSAAPYLNNVSFWAGQSFRSVEIPFTLAAVTGETYTGLMVISNGEGAGGGRAGSVAYTTSGQQPVTFKGTDFDAACRQATNAALNYLTLSLPGSGQGILYYDYRENATPRAFDPNTTLYLTGDTSVNKVTFVPAKGFTGTAYMSFTGTAINGTSFQGTVEVTVRAGAAFGSIVHYSTGGAPVRFQGNDLSAASGVGQPKEIRLTGLPAASQGRVYYQYTSPTKYSWLGNTTSAYSVTGDPSVSNLAFVPKAGYQGVVTIPYAVTSYDGVTSTGSIEITVAPPAVSENFDDLAGYDPQINGAVDYLSSQGVVNGTAPRTYTPGASIRRGDFCLMLSRAFQFDLGGSGQTFKDVSSGAYYAQAVHEMYALGVVNGTGGGYFQPEASISRQDAAVMVRRALDKAGLALPEGSNEAALANYRDRAQVAGYAQEALGSLVRAGLFPASGSQLSPRTAITRADMALLLHRAMTNFS